MTLDDLVVNSARAVTTNRLLRIFDRMALREHDGTHGLLCSVAADVTEQSGAFIALATSDPAMTSYCASGPIGPALMDLEMTLGAGPCFEAHRSETAVEEGDLRASTRANWQSYAPSAGALGARAVFGFPVRMGTVRLGALGLYRDRTGPLSDEQLTDAFLMASVIGRAVLTLQAGAAPGDLSSALLDEAMFNFSVHQAAGMIAAQGQMSIKDAIVALRLHAFAENMSLSDVAASVVARRLRYQLEGRVWLKDSR
ncbi:MAG: GAF domain-containing protein [Acidobacteriota bacterium]|nr:GAF domain-containing protein [Acidobacteriota bacterium]